MIFFRQASKIPKETKVFVFIYILLIELKRALKGPFMAYLSL
jgi:hypothetical protein